MYEKDYIRKVGNNQKEFGIHWSGHYLIKIYDGWMLVFPEAYIEVEAEAKILLNWIVDLPSLITVNLHGIGHEQWQ